MAKINPSEPKSYYEKAVWFTVFYILFFLWALWATGTSWESFSTLELNALGDLFAGFAGPLALVWLIAGFLQQSEELRLSSEALRASVDEQRRSAEHQGQIAALHEQQIKNDLERSSIELNAITTSHYPRFVILASNLGSYPPITINLRATNVGGDAFDVIWSVETEKQALTPRFILDHFSSARSHSFHFNLMSNNDFCIFVIVRVYCVGTDMRHYTSNFHFRVICKSLSISISHITASGPIVSDAGDFHYAEVTDNEPDLSYFP